MACLFSFPAPEKKCEMSCFVLCSPRLECACCGQTVIDLNWRCSKSVPDTVFLHTKKVHMLCKCHSLPHLTSQIRISGATGIIERKMIRIFYINYILSYIYELFVRYYRCVKYSYIYMRHIYTLFFPCLEMTEAFWLTFFAIMKTWINRAYSKENDRQSKLILGKINK